MDRLISAEAATDDSDYVLCDPMRSAQSAVSAVIVLAVESY